MRYRTKQVLIEAFEFAGSVASAEQLAERFPQAVNIGRNGVGDYDGRLIVQTTRGPVNAATGDYVVVEEDGSLNVLTHIAFNAKYERVVAPSGSGTGE